MTRSTEWDEREWLRDDVIVESDDQVFFGGTRRWTT
jgi:hypothetical protein